MPRQLWESITYAWMALEIQIREARALGVQSADPIEAMEGRRMVHQSMPIVPAQLRREPVSLRSDGEWPC